MGSQETTLALSLGFSILGGFFGGIGPQVGWFIGSTIGSLLALEDQNTTTQGTRITDFKQFNSKYGIPINRGYGCVRFAGNMVWASGVTEEAVAEQTCKSTSGIFGLGAQTVCQTVIEYFYYQSAAIAFGEGPCDAITRLWADGQLVYDVTPGGAGVIALQQDANGNAFESSVEIPFVLYKGTATQGIDPTVGGYLGAEATAFRHIIYIVLTDLELGPFGYRLPVFNAETCYQTEAPSTALTNLSSSVSGGSSVSDYESLGLVAGAPNLQIGVSTDTNTQVIYDINTGALIYDSSSAFGSATDTPTFLTLTPDYITLRSRTVSGDFYAGPFNFLTGEQLYWVKYTTAGELAATGGGIRYIIYNRVTGQLCADFAGGGAACFPTYPPTISESLGGTDEVEGYVPVVLGPAELGNSTVIANAGSQFSSFFENGGGTSDPARELFHDPQGNLWWLVDGAGGVWVNRTSAFGSQSHWRVRFTDASNVASVSNWTYDTSTDSFLLQVDVAGTSPVGLYKVSRTAFASGATTVDLPPAVAPNYLSITVVDSSAFQVGPSNGTLYFSTGTNLVQVNTYEVAVAVDYGPPADPIGLATIFSPSTLSIRLDSFNVASFKVGGASDVLANVVADLITYQDGDPRIRLTAADIDVSSLTGDDVRGYPLLQQQTVRAAITPLQQGFFFDTVESDGKIKFIKRNSGDDFNITEDALAAHEYGKTGSTTLVPLEFDRQSDVEQPREFAINYTDYELDYNQSTQRHRIEHTDSDTNLTKTLPIVFSADEAAKIADVLHATAWTERTAPFKFTTGPYFMTVDPTDKMTISMNDGTVHTVRVSAMSIGANGIVEITATNDFASLYTSNAVGIKGPAPNQQVKGGNAVETFIIDVPASFIGASGAGVLGGVGSFGTGTSTGGSIDIGGGAATTTSGVSFGYTTTEFGTPAGPLSTDQFDYETVISGVLLGGPVPTSCDEAGALSGDAACLVIIGREIIAFTTVTANSQTSITGTDISFNNGTSSIDSTTTDFVAAGFAAGMFLRISGSTLNGVSGIYEIASLSANQILLVNPPVTEAAGASITILWAGGAFTLSGGILRGLYGTENATYHPVGDRVVFAENLTFVSGGGSIGSLVVGTGTPTGGGSSSTDLVVTESQNLLPWSPVDVYGGRNGDDFSVSWARRDKLSGAGLRDYVGSVNNSESLMRFEMDIIDGRTAGSENRIVRTLSVSNAESLTYTALQQTTDFGAPVETPLLVDLYQISSVVGRGFRMRTIVDKDNDYRPAGNNFAGDTLAGSAVNVTNRWSASHVIAAGSAVGEQALQLSTLVDTSFAAASFDDSGPAHDTEIYTLLELPVGGLAELHAGIVLRGQGSSAITGFLIGLGGVGNDVFAVRQYLGGQTTPANEYLTQTTYAWSVDVVYSLRARVYGNRIQARIWVYGTTEPCDWQLDTFDGGLGPFFGFGGVFASSTASDPLYHYYSWAHRGLTAA